jgi:AraC-like DNA-binding protein
MQRDPIRQWREQYARACLHLDFKPFGDAPLQASVRPAGDLRMVRTRLSPGVVFRDKDLVQDGDDSLGFLISQSRQLDATHQGREIRLGLGDATMMQASAPGGIGSRESFRFLEVMIPPAEWEARGAYIGDAIMQCFLRQSDAMRLLRGYIRSLETTRLAASADGSVIIRRHVIDLVVLAATARSPIGESSASAVVAALRARALDCIMSSFQNPDLSLTTVANRLCISPRYLQRLLEMSGMSFTAHVNELRLQKAFALLAAAGDARRISDIALEVGFSDISHFNRSFRSRFGDTPSGVRARGGQSEK